MTKKEIYSVSKYWEENSICNKSKYEEMYDASINDPELFWSKQAKYIDWIEPWKSIKNIDFSKNLKINWFRDGKLNASINCLDRHIKNNGKKTAFIWEGDNPEESKRISYEEALIEVCRISNILKKMGVKKGTVVTIYMPMIPEAIFSMLACARIGAIHSVVFGGFSSDALANRILDCNSKCVITSNISLRGGKAIPLKENVDVALEKCSLVSSVLIFNRTNDNYNFIKGRDFSYDVEKDNVPNTCEPEAMYSEDPLFILYTSGSTGKPKGVLHTTGGYLVYASLTYRYVFDYQKEDTYWCTADVGWITGHSYIVYGPLLNCSTSVIFEGVPNYPTPSRFWNIIDKHSVNIFYTAPTAIRALMREGDEFVKSSDRSSLKLLGTVGEPINPEAWKWYYSIVGENNCPIVDTWWQTETGGILITCLPGASSMKPGSAGLPFFGVKPCIVDDHGNELEDEASGNLCMTDSWPGQMRTVYGNHKRFYDTYFSQFKNKYFTGDGCTRDKDGYYWITGRVDDVINVSGHRIGTAEIESAIVNHMQVSESAVVGYKHEIKGQGIFAFITLRVGFTPNENLKKDISDLVKKEISAIAKPDIIQWAPNLPKTRSGKIMRRILRNIAEDNYKDLGDISTLAEPTVVDELIEERKKNIE